MHLLLSLLNLRKAVACRDAEILHDSPEEIIGKLILRFEEIQLLKNVKYL